MDLISKQAAMSVGANRYFTGQPCKHGHVAERFVSSRCCIDCLKERSAAWRKSNPDKCAAMRHNWAEQNPERNAQIKAAWNKAHPQAQAKRARAWFLANREQANAASKKWMMENPGKVNARAARLRAERMQRTPAWADLGQIDQIYIAARQMRESGQCVDVDHVVPLRGKRVSGLHVQNNLQILPTTINKSKSNHFSQ